MLNNWGGVVGKELAAFRKIVFCGEYGCRCQDKDNVQRIQAEFFIEPLHRRCLCLNDGPGVDVYLDLSSGPQTIRICYLGMRRWKVTL
jgi:hypothetical protein